MEEVKKCPFFENPDMCCIPELCFLKDSWVEQYCQIDYLNCRSYAYGEWLLIAKLNGVED